MKNQLWSVGLGALGEGKPFGVSLSLSENMGAIFHPAHARALAEMLLKMAEMLEQEDEVEEELK